MTALIAIVGSHLGLLAQNWPLRMGHFFESVLAYIVQTATRTFIAVITGLALAITAIVFLLMHEDSLLKLLLLLPVVITASLLLGIMFAWLLSKTR